MKFSINAESELFNLFVFNLYEDGWYYLSYPLLDSEDAKSEVSVAKSQNGSNINTR